MTTKENIKIEDKNGLAFIKEVAKYFMDFLETDFHKRKSPPKVGFFLPQQADKPNSVLSRRNLW